MGIKDLLKWNRAAIVTDKESIQKFTELFSKVMVGEFKAFNHLEYHQAISWASEQIDA